MRKNVRYLDDQRNLGLIHDVVGAAVLVRRRASRGHHQPDQHRQNGDEDSL